MKLSDRLSTLYAHGLDRTAVARLTQQSVERVGQWERGDTEGLDRQIQKLLFEATFSEIFGFLKQQKALDELFSRGISRTNIARLLGADFTTRKTPRDENDVIGLFFEMAGRGLFPNYRVFGLSQKDTYDCRAAIRRETESEKTLEPADDSKLRIVEFKIHAVDAIRDFERSQKFSREIDLLVAWDIGSYESKNYTVYDIDQSEAYKAGLVFPGVSKYIYDSREGSEVQILVLEEIIARLKEEIGEEAASES
jgi:hypothetical protein